MNTQRFVAAKSFGKFKDSFLAEIHSEVAAHAKQDESGHAPQPVQGIVVHDSEVLEPDPVRQGGLMRKEAVCCPSRLHFGAALTIQPLGPHFPPTCQTDTAAYTSRISAWP